MANNREQILKLTEQVGELNGKVDQIDKNITLRFTSLENQIVNIHNSLKNTLKNHEDRLNAQENEFSQMKGKVAGIALAVSLVISIITTLLGIFKHYPN